MTLALYCSQSVNNGRDEHQSVEAGRDYSECGKTGPSEEPHFYVFMNSHGQHVSGMWTEEKRTNIRMEHEMTGLFRQDNYTLQLQQLFTTISGYL